MTAFDYFGKGDLDLEPEDGRRKDHLSNSKSGNASLSDSSIQAVDLPPNVFSKIVFKD